MRQRGHRGQITLTFRWNIRWGLPRRVWPTSGLATSLVLLEVHGSRSQHQCCRCGQGIEGKRESQREMEFN